MTGPSPDALPVGWHRRRWPNLVAAVAVVAAMLAAASCSKAPESRPQGSGWATTTVVGGPGLTEAEPRHEPIWIDVSYRPDPVDIAYPGRFELLVPDSTLVDTAAYDQANRYLLISLNDGWYHYCRVPESLWNALAGADSKGRFYNAELKGSYDCREGGVPTYKP